MTIHFSRGLAIVGGILTPLAETIRRWHTWRDSPESFFDDYILGGFLLYAAWRAGKDLRAGQKYLAAAWAFACGLGYYSFFGQLRSVRLNQGDPAPISAEWVLAIKGVMVALAILGLIASLRRLPETVE